MSFILNKLDSIDSDTKNKETEEGLMLVKENEGDGVNTASSNETNLSADASFKGAIQFKSSLRIDGRFEGEINSKGTLYIGKTGIVKAEISVGNVIVEGKVHGNICAENKIELKSTARLFGDIKANKLIIAEGVSFVGNCNVNPGNEKVDDYNPPSSASIDKQADLSKSDPKKK